MQAEVTKLPQTNLTHRTLKNTLSSPEKTLLGPLLTGSLLLRLSDLLSPHWKPDKIQETYPLLAAYGLAGAAGTRRAAKYGFNMRPPGSALRTAAENWSQRCP